MKKIDDSIIHFLRHENFAIVSSIGEKGTIHNSCKGVVDIKPGGKIYFMDLYKQRTYDNLKRNNNISLTVVNEHKFQGYCLKGKASIVSVEKLSGHLLELWEKKVTSRLSHRVLKNISGEKGHHSHPEALLPEPEYLIEMEVESIVDLTPHAIN